MDAQRQPRRGGLEGARQAFARLLRRILPRPPCRHCGGAGVGAFGQVCPHCSGKGR